MRLNELRPVSLVVAICFSTGCRGSYTNGFNRCGDRRTYFSYWRLYEPYLVM